MFLVFPRMHLRVHLLFLPTVCMMLWLEGAASACLLLLAALLHECGHLTALHALHIPVKRIDVLPMGAVIAYDDSVCPHRHTAWAAFAGAGANLTAMLVCLPFAGNLYVLLFVIANAALACMNLLPIETLDGGTVLRSVLAQTRFDSHAERICRIASRLSLLFLAVFFCAVGLYSAFALWYLLLSAVMLVQIFR
ncbi:MAG: site-2 protease family protein [Clostridia bacterium]|nr:site-2 protease family protein [Clostridia bacterium]